VVPTFCPEDLASLMRDCWQDDPAERPDFDEIFERLSIARRALAAMERAARRDGGASAGNPHRFRRGGDGGGSDDDAGSTGRGAGSGSS